jgi:hypothetical protein
MYDNDGRPSLGLEVKALDGAMGKVTRRGGVDKALQWDSTANTLKVVKVCTVTLHMQDGSTQTLRNFVCRTNVDKEVVA